MDKWKRILRPIIQPYTAAILDDTEKSLEDLEEEHCLKIGKQPP